MRTRISIIIAAALSALALASVPTAGAATDARIAPLAGSANYPAANGKVKSSIDDGVRQVEGQLEDVRALANKRVEFLFRGKVVDTATVTRVGVARFAAAGAAVPAVAAGTPARVQTAAGVLVASGRFG